MGIRRATIPEMFQAVRDVLRGGRSPFEPGDSMRGGKLLDYRAGTFSRNFAATYHTGPDTLALAAIHEPRFEDRKDGLGPLLLIEGSRTNLVGYANAMSSWSGGATNATITDNAATDPLGTSTATSLVMQGTGSYSRYNTWGSATAGEVYTLSVWAKGQAGGDVGKSFRLLCTNTASSVVNRIDSTLAAGWQRYRDTRTAVNSTRVVYYDNRVNTPTGGDSALPAWNGYVWGHQLELARFASSFIPAAAGSSVTRPADSLTYPASATPEVLRSGRWKRPIFAPLWGSAEVISGNTFALDGWTNSANVIQLRHNGTGVILEVKQGGAVKIASGVMGFSAHQPLSFSFVADQGAIEVQGATSGNGIVTGGTPWVMPDGTYRVGGIAGGSSEAYGRFAQPVRI